MSESKDIWGMNPEAKSATVAQLESAARLLLDCCPHDGPTDDVMRERLLDFRDRLYGMPDEAKYSDGRGQTIKRFIELVEWSLGL